MDERSQLIENIILSEIKYAEWKAELETAEGERADELRHFIADDDRTIAQWMDKYGITFDYIAAERQRVLRRAQTDKAAAYDREKAAAEEQIAQMITMMAEIPQRKEDSLAVIDDLLTKPSVYS